MNSRQAVLLISTILTSLLIGGLLAGWRVFAFFQTRLSDPAFLEKRASEVAASETQGEPATRKVKLVRTAPAVREKLGSTRFFSGRLVEIHKVVIASEIASPIVSMPIEVGMPVKKGESLIAEIDTIWTHLAIEQAEKRIEVSRVKLRYEEDELERYTQLNTRGKGMVSESDLEMQKLKVEELKANIDLEEVLLREAKKKLERSKIYAPFDGTVVRKIADVGGYISPGTSIAEIVSTGKIDAELTITENYIDRLHVGDKIPVWIDPLNIETEGEIFSIVSYGSTAARAFPIRIRMDDMDGHLKIGMSVRGRIQVTDSRESIVVPKDAVLDRPDGALTWVVVDQTDENGAKTGNKVVEPIQVGIAARTDEKYAIVPLAEEGAKILVPGVECVIEGAERLSVGEEVKVIGIDPAMTANLPKAFGHMILPRLEDNPFFNLPDENQDSSPDSESTEANSRPVSQPAPAALH